MLVLAQRLAHFGACLLHRQQVVSSVMHHSDEAATTVNQFMDNHITQFRLFTVLRAKGMVESLVLGNHAEVGYIPWMVRSCKLASTKDVLVRNFIL